MIISQQWYPEAVQSIQLPHEKRSIEEIFIMYKSCLCILQSKQLMQSLRNFEKLSKMRDLCIKMRAQNLNLVEIFQIKQTVCWAAFRVECGNMEILMENLMM